LILVSWIYVLINSEAPVPGIYFFLGFVLITCISSNFRNSFCVTLVSLLKKIVSPLKKDKRISLSGLDSIINISHLIIIFKN
jgi:hypothetical protein